MLSELNRQLWMLSWWNSNKKQSHSNTVVYSLDLVLSTRQHMAHALCTLQNTISATKCRMYVYKYVRTCLMYSVLCFQLYALLELLEPFYGLYTWWRYIENTQILHAEDILGRNLWSLKGNMTRRTPSNVILSTCD